MTPLMKEKLDHLLDLSLKLAKIPGQNATSIPFLNILRNDRPMPVTRGCLEPSVCLILQGLKRINISNKVNSCGPGDFLVSVIDMPLKAQITGVSAKKPYIGIFIKFDPEEVYAVIKEADIKINKQAQLRPGAFTGKADIALIDLFSKLLILEKLGNEKQYLYSLAKKELIFYILTSDFGDYFFQEMILSHERFGVGRVIEWIKKHYSEDLSIDQIVQISGMSASALFMKFKKITSTTPIQYQKQLRLQEARRLLINGETNATMASIEVGYASPTQFNREYKRYFGNPPLKDVSLSRNGTRS